MAEEPCKTGCPDKLWTEFTIFPCGAVWEDNNETWRIYYAAGEYSTNLAFTALSELRTVMTPCSRITNTPLFRSGSTIGKINKGLYVKIQLSAARRIQYH